MNPCKNIKKYILDILVILGFAIFVSVSYANHYQHGMDILEKTFWGFFKEMLLILPAMFVIIGLFDVWIPKEKIEKHIGSSSGIKGIIWVILLAFVQAGPLYVSFPVAWLLWKKGCSGTNVFIYLSAFTTAKIPMLAFEIGFLGWQFSIIRILITFPVFIFIGIIMGRYFDRNKCTIKN